MVFFTCNSCGQCVKKAHVEKHYLTECRSCEVLSCMDCGKDFVGDDYKHHTKCVSENEKYGGKDYRANAKPNKGEVKQSQWIECVQAASVSQSVTPRVRGLLNRLADYNNIPRKKAKFERFVQNSLKVWDASLIEQIWAVFSEAGSKQKVQTEQKPQDEAGKQETGGTKQDSKPGQQKTASLESSLQNGESSEIESDKHCKPEKKKKKRDKHLEVEQEEGRPSKKKKEKHKKDLPEDEEEAQDVPRNEETQMGTHREMNELGRLLEDGSQKKKKKKKKHKHELIIESKVEESQGGTDHISKKKNKKKSKHTESGTHDNRDVRKEDVKESEGEDISLQESDLVQQTEKKKKKKKTKLKSTNDESGVQLEIQDENVNMELESPSSKTKKLKRRSLEMDSADDFQLPIKKKKQAKLVIENGHIAPEKKHKRKK